MTWDFAPFSLRGVDSNDTVFPARFQIQIIIFFKKFVISAAPLMFAVPALTFCPYTTKQTIRGSNLLILFKIFLTS